MLILIAVLIAVFFLPAEWDAIVIIAAAVFETGNVIFWRWYSRRGRPTVGTETMIGEDAEVVEACNPEGWVRVQGELWRARCERGAPAGERVRVKEIDGLTLIVE